MDIENWHPKLVGEDYKILKSPNKNIGDYNCFAYVLDIYDEWHGPTTGSCPIDKIKRSSRIDNITDYFKIFGYELCDNGEYEKDFDKIAIYVKKGFVTHVSRQYANKWRIKLGPGYLIEHELKWLTGYDAENYGDIGAIIKRSK